MVSPARRGFGVGLVTTAMFLGAVLRPILVQPFIDPSQPVAVWRSVSVILAVLAVVYLVLSQLGKKET